ncbi:PREDICTED: ATP-dependent DNA helicase PIF4-like, partial [Ipomoea nil]|uniref:ATP-dependent DNA helicase PIF4-like n=1 Tax=Ipomoea nil TaxID=35883 RepID=UPI0009012262
MGKTFLWRALSSALRSKGDIVLNVASSGIASLLLPGGRTAHSRFSIPIAVNEDSTCNISQSSPLAQLIMQSKLIIWDEAPMMHKFCFEALDCTMRDIMRAKNPKSLDMTFGGKTVVLGGDFRQILPVIPKGTRQDIVGASINASYLWRSCKVFRLTKNLRLRSLQSDTEVKEIEKFAKWIANIGDGTIGDCLHGEYRAILTPTLDIVDAVNEYMNDYNNAEGRTYLSCDSVCKSNSNVDMLPDLHTAEFLNGLTK